MAGLGRRSHYRKHLTDAVLHDLPEPDFSNGERIAKVVGTRGSNQFEIIVSPAPNTSANDDDDDVASSESKTATPNNNNNNNNCQHIQQLAILPTKFRKLVWVKRNDFVIVQSAQEEEKKNGGAEEENETAKAAASETVGDISGGIRYLITHILYKDQVKHLVQKKIWPLDDPFFDTENVNANKGYNTGLSLQDQQQRRDGDNNASLSDEDSSEIEGEEEYGVDDNDDGIVYEHSGAYDDDYFVNTNRIAKLDIQDSDDESSESSDDDDDC